MSGKETPPRLTIDATEESRVRLTVWHGDQGHALNMTPDLAAARFWRGLEVAAGAARRAAERKPKGTMP